MNTIIEIKGNSTRFKIKNFGKVLHFCFFLFFIHFGQYSYGQDDYFYLIIPQSTSEVDLQVWKPYKSPNVPEGKGHTYEWISKDGFRLAFDAESENSHWHLQPRR